MDFHSHLNLSAAAEAQTSNFVIVAACGPPALYDATSYLYRKQIKKRRLVGEARKLGYLVSAEKLAQRSGRHRCQILFFHLSMQGKIQFPKANTSPSVKTITRVCLFYIIEQCWRESLDAKTSLSCLTTLAHVLNEKVMALKRCQHHKTAIFRCGLETVKNPCCNPWITLVFHLRGRLYFYIRKFDIGGW